MDDSKALEIVNIELTGKSSLADNMIIASGTSDRHVRSIATKLAQDLKIQGVTGVEPEGLDTGDWVLIDTGDIIVHIFKPDTREKYDLEGMWSFASKKKSVG